MEKKINPVTLIIDDDASVCRLFEKYLEHANFDAHSVSTIEDALSFLESQAVDLILLDLHLGDVNSLEHLAELQKVAVGTRIWILTAYSSIETVVLAMRAGAVGFFTKSQSPETIIQELEAAFFSPAEHPAQFEVEKIAFEKSYLIRLLKASKGNVSEASRLSGQHRPQLYRLMQRYSIAPNQYS